MRRSIRQITLLAALSVVLSACLFKTAEPVIIPQTAVRIPVQAGYIYSIEEKGQPGDPQKLALKDPAANLYLLFDEDETKPPMEAMFAALGHGAYLVQIGNPPLRAGNRQEFFFEYTILKIEEGAAYGFDDTDERFESLIKERQAAKFLSPPGAFFPALEVQDKSKLIAALKEFAASSTVRAMPSFCDAVAMKRLFPGKSPPK